MSSLLQDWYWVAGIIVVVLLGLMNRRGERASSSGERRQTDAPPTEAEIDALVRTGRKIEAIKLYRMLHRVDLRRAKDAIDARSRTLGG